MGGREGQAEVEGSRQEGVNSDLEGTHMVLSASRRSSCRLPLRDCCAEGASSEEPSCEEDSSSWYVPITKTLGMSLEKSMQLGWAERMRVERDVMTFP